MRDDLDALEAKVKAVIAKIDGLSRPLFASEERERDAAAWALGLIKEQRHEG